MKTWINFKYFLWFLLSFHSCRIILLRYYVCIIKLTGLIFIRNTNNNPSAFVDLFQTLFGNIIFAFCVKTKICINLEIIFIWLSCRLEFIIYNLYMLHNFLESGSNQINSKIIIKCMRKLFAALWVQRK